MTESADFSICAIVHSDADAPLETAASATTTAKNRGIAISQPAHSIQRRETWIAGSQLNVAENEA
jgi:hypothetical protein